MSDEAAGVKSRALSRRAEQLERIARTCFDVAIIGAGVNGASLFNRLRSAGYRVLLIDKGDFGCGSSQSSGMLVWGGLPYLRQLEVKTVWSLCACRDRWIKDAPEWVAPQRFRFVLSPLGKHGQSQMVAVLHAYWLLGCCRRARPRLEVRFPESRFLEPGSVSGSLVYEEARLSRSDTRFVLQLIVSEDVDECVAVNYCELDSATFGPADRLWRLLVRERLGSGIQAEVRSRFVVNAAGVWVDRINRRCEMASPYAHVLSKGVFVAVSRLPRHNDVLIMDVGVDGDCRALIPWGPVSLWGPTQSSVDTVEQGFKVSPDEVRLLLAELNEYAAEQIRARDIVSFRCGLRPLAVRRGQRSAGCIRKLSRSARIWYDSSVPWVSIYGGKITGSVSLADSVCARIRGALGAPRRAIAAHDLRRQMSERKLAQNEPAEMPAVRWCIEREMCWTLDDYLRRRTNIAQWVPRAGLGRENENLSCLETLSRDFPTSVGDGHDEVLNYTRRVAAEFDTVIAAC